MSVREVLEQVPGLEEFPSLPRRRMGYLTPYQRAAMCLLWADGWSAGELAMCFEVRESTVYEIVRGVQR